MKSAYGHYEEMPEDWQLKTLSEIGKIVGGGTPDTTDRRYWGGEIAWAVPTDITNLNGRFIESTERYITQEGLHNSSAKLLPVGTILITSRATIGECAINKIPMTTNQGFQSLICNSESDNTFMYYALKSNKNKLLRLAYGSTFLEVSSSNIKKVTLLCPSINEQQKIASILSKVDELLQKTDQIIQQTQRLKKGLMQRILTKGIGHTRFKPVLVGSKSLSIEIPESWALASLSKIARVIDVRHQTPTYTDEGFPLILPNNVKLVGLDLENTKFTNEEDFLYMTGGGRHPAFGDIVYSRNASFGVACRIETDQKFSLGQDLVLIKPEKINSYLLCLILNSRFVNIQLVRLSTGSTFQRINLDLIRNFMIAYPVDSTEQNKIAENVQKIDNLIGSHKIYRDILIALKRCKNS